MGSEKSRVLLTKSALDAHDRGVRHIAKKLMESGGEVIFTRYGLPEEVVATALQEDVGCIGISSSFASYGDIMDVLNVLKDKQVNIPVVVGGVIVPSGVEKLMSAGVKAYFGPGSSVDEAVNCMMEMAKAG